MNENPKEAFTLHDLSATSGSCPPMSLKLPGPEFAHGIAPQLRAQEVYYPNGRSSYRRTAPSKGHWLQYIDPFIHYRAINVLDSTSLTNVSRQFSLILEATEGKREGEFKLKKLRSNYDALILPMTPSLAASFIPLFTEDWLRSLAELLGLKFLPRIEGALHSNPKGSTTGWIHTDLCSAWFDERGSSPDKLMFPPRGRCNYFNGKPTTSDVEPKEYIRAATMIFYLCNDGWKPGDGGETGLYGAAHESKHTDMSLVPPVNNSLLLFECSPHSYHRFVENPGRRRNSLILWLHSSVEDAEAKWGSAINRPQVL